jgi:hypothetical protein
MKCSMRNLLVIPSSIALVAALSLSFSGCKKHQLTDTGGQAQNGSAQGTGQSVVGQNDSTGGGAQNPSGHGGSWSAKDAQVAAGQPSVGHTGNTTSSGAESATNNKVTNGNVATGGSSGAIPANGSTPANGAAPVNATAPAVAEGPKEIPVTCFVETFKHKATPGHDSDEACSHHKNLVSLSHKVINPKSVCVRVNDVPVKFQTVTGGELLIGSIAGPKATISVSYCTGKNTCEFTKKNDCVVPKDEFLDAIGGSDTDEGAVAQWENTGNNEADAKLNNDVKRELADIDDAAPEHADVFKNWTNEKTSPSCGQATAKK